MRQVSVANSYAVLGLEEGSSLEQVKMAYKQRALTTHPDKNPANPGATAEFQQVSEAYRTLARHLERASKDDYSTENNDYDYDSDSYYDDDYDSDDMDEIYHFYEKLFELFMRGESHSHLRYRRRPRTPEETDEQVRERARRMCEEQELAEERRKQESAARKHKAELEREKERIAAEERQKTKMVNKKARVQSQREKAANAARVQQQRIQQARTAVFTAARAGDSAGVKKGVWADGVDAAGPELKKGCEGSVKSPSHDPEETLLHIAVKMGDLDLVKWLDGHGADPEERNSEQLTPFHISLLSGHVPIAVYFFEEHPPSTESNAIYDSPADRNLLSIALGSCEPEIIWMVLDKELATAQEIRDAWVSLTSDTGSLAWKQPDQKVPLKDIVDDIEKLLVRYGGSPATTSWISESSQGIQQAHSRTPSMQVSAQAAQVIAVEKDHSFNPRHSRGRGRGRERAWIPPTTAAR